MSLILVNVVQVLLCMGLAILVLACLEKPVRDLLDRLIGMPSATTFFVRVLGLSMLLLALKEAVIFIDKQDDAWTYSFKLMHGWADMMEPAYAVLLVFAGLITVLVAVLRHGHQSQDVSEPMVSAELDHHGRD